MNNKRLAVIQTLMVAAVIGCSGNYGILKYHSESDSKATKRELIDNWSEYNIWLVYRTAYKPPLLIAIVFHTKNDNRELMLEGIGSKVKVKDPEMWTEAVKENTTSDGELALGRLKDRGPRSSTGVLEILGPDNQLYGYIVYQEYAVVPDRVEMVDEKTIRITGRPPRRVGGR